MTYKRKNLLVALMTLILLISPFNSTKAQSNIIYESTAKQTITSGVTLENITRFTTEGWLNINVLKIDLSNQYVKVDTMANPDSINKLISTKAITQIKGAVASINASFFDPTGSGNGYPLGPIVESGKIVSAWNGFNETSDQMASFSIDQQKKALYNYWKTQMTLVAPNGKSNPVALFNKPSGYDYMHIVVYDRKWSQFSPGASEKYPDMIELVVEDGKIAEIREAQPAVEIPVNGYVIVSRKAGGKFLKDNFKLGDEVGLNMTTNPDWSKINMSVTGGAILVKEGKIPTKFSFDNAYISKRHPRTAVGSTKDGKQLIMVTVDGRQNLSIGMTQDEIAKLMLELGAYNALNLDGGGSTTMIARTPDSDSLEVVNSPSDGTSRLISTAIGIFSIAPPSSLSGLIIDTEDDNIFVGTSRSFTVRGYDRYFNPVEVKPEQIKWSVSGIKGIFKGNTFYPESIGEGKITARVGNVTGELAISSLSSPVQLKLNTKSIKLPLDHSKSFTATGINKYGYNAKINPEDIKWSVNGNIGQFSKNTFTAKSQGTGYIDASVGDTHAYCTVSIASVSTSLKDKFEAKNGEFISYPDTVKGSYTISTEQKYSGKTSGKLTYDFSNTEGTRAAYLAFSNEGLSLDVSSQKLGVWVYNTHENSNWLRAEIYDASGKKHMIDFVKFMDWKGWKQVEASLEGITAPAKLTRLYIVQVNPIADSGTIYFDDLTVTASSYPAVDMSKIPQDTEPVDEANKSIAYKKSSSSFRFAVFGESRDAQNPLEKLLLRKLSEKTNKYLEAGVFVGSNSHQIVETITKPVISTYEGYNFIDMKNTRLIQLDMSKQGLRLTDASQWGWFLQQLDSFKGDNVFISLAGSPDSFSDKLEANLFKETLTNYRKKTHKNVWVFFKSNKNTSYMERGVKYISTAGFDVENLTPDNTDACTYLLVTVNGYDVTFQFKPII